MNIATLSHPQIAQGVQAHTQAQALHYNKYAYASLALALLFVFYIFLPHPAPLKSLFSFTVFFILIVPISAFILSIMSIRHAARTKEAEKGTTLGYVALGVTSLYFMTALAIPVVLVGLYVLYAYVI
jgi:EamA domain-containing membrane protein RarD